MDSLAFLKKPPEKIGSLYVLPGDEGFLKRQVLQLLKQRLGPDCAEACSTHEGDGVTLGDVWDELSTAPFFSPRRLVVIENADPFVSKFRAHLEKKVGQVPGHAVLVLEVKTWPANTRLAKLVPDSATLVCKAPVPQRLSPWCQEWCASQYQKRLAVQAASLLVDLIGPEMGLLDQELLKLSIYVGVRETIEPDDVDRLVGRSREENTWKIFDALAQGQAAEAFGILDRLFDQGEDPFRLLGAFSSQLRRLAQAARWSAGGMSLGSALEKAGVPPFGVRGAEQQLRHLGRQRAGKLYDWLLEISTGLRGGSPLPPRTLLERLLARLAGKI